MNEYFASFAFHRPCSDQSPDYDCSETLYFYPSLSTPIIFYDAETGARVIKPSESVDW